MTDHAHLPGKAIDALERWPLLDNAIVRHGFVPHLRDYEIIVETAAAGPDESGSYPEGRYRFLFTHCVIANVTTAVRDEVWQTSWDDVFTDSGEWEARGSPGGYVWGVCYADAYPGAKVVAPSELAAEWVRRLGRPMAEVKIATNAQSIQLVFHALRLYRIAEGNPATRVLTDIEPYDLLAAT